MVQIDFSRLLSPIKPMNAVNNGPDHTPLTNTGNGEAYRALAIPYARNHDAAFCTAYGGEFSVDVHRIFRDFSADENDPASYCFAMTDEYIRKTMDVGTETFYRLGAAIEHKERYGTRPPADFAKWARVCEHIIRHYTEGWANGFDAGITYWEIWNEPDCINPDGTNPCWQGTKEDFFRLFVTAFSYLKGCFPHLKIGGPALTDGAGAYMKDFLAYCRAHDVHPDFLSYHWYGSDTRQMRAYLRDCDRTIREAGFAGTQRILNEWNYNLGWVGKLRTDSARGRLGQVGAAFAGAVMLLAQREPVDMLMYYDARPNTSFNGLFSPYLLDPLPTYDVFCLFRDLRALGTEAESTESPDRGLYVGGATDEKGKGGVMLVRYRDTGAEACETGGARTVNLRLTMPAGVCSAQARIYTYRAGQQIVLDTLCVQGTQPTLSVDMEENEALFISFAFGA